MILAVEQLSVRRGGRTIFTDVSLAADAGEIVGITAPNGLGKSTLLLSVAGVLAPRDGRVLVDGASVWGGRRERRRARTALGYLPEWADVPLFLTGSELWSLVATARATAAPGQALVDALGLAELAELRIGRMSLGQQRRACLAAALLGPPRLLVLDEPDNGLDVARLDAMIALVRAHAEAGGACLLASHDAALLDRLGARVVPLTTPPRQP